MNEFIKKLIGRLAELGWVYADYYPDETAIHRQRKKSVAYDDVIAIVNQLAEEYNKKYEPTMDLLEYGVEGYNRHLQEQYRKGYEDAKKENSWIPCSERLPDKSGWFLCTQEYHSLTNGNLIKVTTELVEFYDNKWRRANNLVVTHWQPLPQPYQPKGEKV